MLAAILQVITLPLRIWFYLARRLRALRKPRWVELSLTGKLDEHPPAVGLAAWLRPSTSKFYMLLLHLQAILQSSQQNPNKSPVKEITVTVHAPRIGWGRAWEVQEIFRRLGDAGVKVRAFLLSGDLMSYYIALGAAEVYAPPALSLDLLGLRIESFYFKEFFDRWSIKPNFIHIGRFKSAAERFTQKKGSSFAKSQLRDILKNVEKEVVSSIKEQREGKVSKTLAHLQGRSPIAATESAKLGLLDGVLYYDQLREVIAHENGWGKPGRSQGVDRAVRLLSDRRSKLFAFKKPKKVAIIIGEGPIVDASEPNPMAISLSDYQGAMQQVGQGSFDAVLLRWNSPGGSALVSDLLWQDLMSIRAGSTGPYFDENEKWLKIPVAEQTEEPPAEEEKPKKKKKKKRKEKKPHIFVSQSDVAASGGYYLSAICNEVYASPLTITGSIGVVGGKFNLSGLLSKMGVKLDTVDVGNNSDLYSPFSNFTAAQKRHLTRNMENMYELFRNRITQGRGMEDKVLKKLGEGRIYSGNSALELGLVDHKGGMLDVLSRIREELKVRDKDQIAVAFFPRIKAPLIPRSGLLPSFMSKLSTLAQLTKENVLFLDDLLL